MERRLIINLESGEFPPVGDYLTKCLKTMRRPMYVQQLLYCWNKFRREMGRKEIGYDSFRVTVNKLVKEGVIEPILPEEAIALGLDLGKHYFPRSYYRLPTKERKRK